MADEEETPPGVHILDLELGSRPDILRQSLVRLLGSSSSQGRAIEAQAKVQEQQGAMLGEIALEVSRLSDVVWGEKRVGGTLGVAVQLGRLVEKMDEAKAQLETARKELDGLQTSLQKIEVDVGDLKKEKDRQIKMRDLVIGGILLTTLTAFITWVLQGGLMP